ncbi:hypothetical protein Emed_005379 [Eimeria media]
MRTNVKKNGGAAAPLPVALLLLLLRLLWLLVLIGLALVLAWGGAEDAAAAALSLLPVLSSSSAAAAAAAAAVAVAAVSSSVSVYNEDARAFLRSALEPSFFGALLEKRMQQQAKPAAAQQQPAAAAAPAAPAAAPEIHVLMNLPESAIEFLDVFGEALTRAKDQGGVCTPEPQPKKHRAEEACCNGAVDTPETTAASTPAVPRWRIHCYAFSRNPRPEEELRPRVEAALGCWPQPVEIFEVRDVAPHKRMYCLSFDLPPSLRFAQAATQAVAAATQAAAAAAATQAALAATSAAAATQAPPAAAREKREKP